MLRRYFAGGVCRSKAMLDGKTVIRHYWTAGIGKETAIDLAKRNAQAILAYRSQEKGKKAEVDVRRESGSSSVAMFTSTSSIKSLLKKFYQKRHI